VTAQIKNLANLIQTKRASGQKFVLMLGAGASISSGVRKTPLIMEELLQKFGMGIPGGTLEERFDTLWQGTPDPDRETLLRPYFDVEPSSGYQKLAQLIEAGFFDLAITLNFDDLLEKALQKRKFSDYKLIIRGETANEEMEKLVEVRSPRFKLLKLHGSLHSSKHFLFTAEEMLKYPDPVESLLKKITSSDIIVCGYAFEDLCVIRAFAYQGGAVICVNPAGVPRQLRAYLKNRRSEGWDIVTDFDSFAGELQQELQQTPQPVSKPLLNPFKFLESYEEADWGSLKGRDDETAKFFRTLVRKPPPQFIVLTGPGRAGKTSLVKAALLPALDTDKYRGVYLRCRPELENSLPRDLARIGLGSVGLDVISSLRQLERDSAGRHVVLFLDQFERVTDRFQSRTPEGLKKLNGFLHQHVFPGSSEGMTIVLVLSDEGLLGAQLIQECLDQGISATPVLCMAFDRAAVADIIQSLAQQGEIEFEPRIIEHMLDRYERSRDALAPDKRFTLAHIQAVCHILSNTRQVNFDSYERAFDKTQEALNQAINVHDIISFVEDFAWTEAAWFRNIIKVPLRESIDKIAEFIQAHYEELLPVSRQRRPTTPSPQPAPIELKI
jgi:hypothetical protein